jgi:hypothetical protein
LRGVGGLPHAEVHGTNKNETPDARRHGGASLSVNFAERRDNIATV